MLSSLIVSTTSKTCQRTRRRFHCQHTALYQRSLVGRIRRRTNRALLTTRIQSFESPPLRFNSACLSSALQSHVLTPQHQLFSTAAVTNDNGEDADADVEPDTGVEAHLESKGITSRPKPGGNWNVQDPLGWTRDFGRRSPATQARLDPLIRLIEGDPGYYKHNARKEDKDVPEATIVRTKEQAQTALQHLLEAPPDTLHACDTEVMDIDIKSVGPVGNGYVTCLSIYSGPDFDYGLGGGPGKVLWIDNLDEACGLLQEFKDWLEDSRYLKVWHNLGFDRHVLWNEGIDVRGFGGDTMHMARLLDTSRMRGIGKGYSLEALTDDWLNQRKKPMKEVFGVARLRKDGTEGKMKDVPPVEELQRNPQHRVKWIRYSSHDAMGTYGLFQYIRKRLENKPWIEGKSMYDYYHLHMRPFGELLTDMERRGIRVDAKDYLASVEKTARQDRASHEAVFRKWAAEQYPPEMRQHGLALNPASSTQLATFLFGGCKNPKTGDMTELEREFKIPIDEISKEAMDAHHEQAAREQEALVLQRQADAEAHGVLRQQIQDLEEDLKAKKAVQLKEDCKRYDLPVTGRKAELQERMRKFFLGDPLPSDDEPSVLRPTLLEEYLGLSRSGESPLHEKKESKFFNLKVCSLQQLLPSIKPLKPVKATAGGAPSVTADVLKKLAGDPFSDPPKYGAAVQYGEEACEALHSLCMIGSIDTMIANFLTSLQELVDDDSRVHGSINLNTETGRLSSRRPNLQNQPALEKDKYKIRKAFQSSPGNNLIVADYGQLELRILASLTNCQSMIDAFESGGDFHSRTAVDMFDYIREKVESGDVLLEWDYSKGAPTKPMVKDEYGSERRKAKTLNFSIAYGKTAHGLSKDWGVSKGEAEDMLKKWYDARPEVRDWQQKTKETAQDQGITRTLMGRYRDLPDAMTSSPKLLGHALRASINTPIQGGAADIAMMAMLKINESPKLKDLGWILLLQIHDEVILEGPEETAEEAFHEVVKCMEEPWTVGLDVTKVPLAVDGSHVHKTWYDAK